MEQSGIQPVEPAARSVVGVHRGRGDLRLAIECFGQQPPTLLYTHGFGQNRQAWRAAANHLAELGWSGIAVDGRGHGESEWQPDGHYELDHFAEDLTAIARSLPQKPVLVGASMGGLLGLLTEAETGGGLYSALVLVDVTPRWENQGVDRILSFMAMHPEGFANLQAAADAIADYLPHRDRKNPERLRTQLRLGMDGRWRWHWDPRLLAQVAGQAQAYIPRLQRASARIDVPVLLLSGERSDVVSADTIREFRALVPHAEHIEIARATHTVVGDRNDLFTREIAAFLRRLDHRQPVDD